MDIVIKDAWGHGVTAPIQPTDAGYRQAYEVIKERQLTGKDVKVDNDYARVMEYARNRHWE